MRIVQVILFTWLCSLVTGDAPIARAEEDRPLPAAGWEELEPQPLHRVAPDYPPAALNARIEGNVAFDVTIMTDGSVADVELVSVTPEGWTFEDASKEAVLQWRYSPQIHNGAVIPRAGVRVTFNFRLQRGPEGPQKPRNPNGGG